MFDPFSPCRHKAHESDPGSDTTSCVEALLYTDADMTVAAVIDNPKVHTHTHTHTHTPAQPHINISHYCSLLSLLPIHYCSTQLRWSVLIQYGDN
jgi:hypothetical protein